MTDMMGSPSKWRNHGNGSSIAMDVTSPSLRRSHGGSSATSSTMMNHNGAEATTETASEPKLFSPRSTAAMALSSISQIFSSAAPPTSERAHPPPSHHLHPTTTRAMLSHDKVTMISQQPSNHRPTSSLDHLGADVSTMTQMVHTQLPPPQYLFRSSTNAAGTSNDSASPSYTEKDHDSGGPLPFIPNLPPTDHHPQYRTVSGEVPHPPPPPQYFHQHYPHHHHHSNFSTADGSAAVTYASRNDTDPHSQPAYYAPSNTAMHSGMMVMMKRQPSFPPPSCLPDELPINSSYTSPQHPPQIRTAMVANHPGGTSDTPSLPHSHIKPKLPRPYDLESQMLPASNHPHHSMTTTMMMMGQPQSQQQQQPYPPSTTTTTMTPAAGTKRDFSSTAQQVPNHWTTPAPPNSMPRNHGTPSHNINNCGSHSHHSNTVAGANHQLQYPPTEHHQHSTPYHPIHRCSSYGSAGSVNHNTAHYDVGPVPQQMQHPPPQFLPPPPPPPPHQQGVTSGPYNPRSVSWSNHEPLAQWIPYNAPPHFMSIVPHQPHYYPTPSHMIPTYPYVTPTPHKKQKLVADNTRTPSKLLSANVFHPPKAPLTKKKKPQASVKASPTASQSTTTPGHDDHSTQDEPTSSDRRAELAAIVEEAQNKYNRKNKSLGLLAESFLSHFTGKRDEEGNDQCQEIMVDRLSIDLSVERRRIYDVVNILEALQVIIKIGKNTYHWMGRQHLQRQFALLQNEAIEAWPDFAAKSGFHPFKPSCDRPIERNGSKDREASSFVGAANLLDPNNEGSNKSLTRLSQLFLQVFLVCDEPLSLPQASDLIHGGRSTNAELLALGMKAGDVYPTDEKRLQQMVARGLKTKIRRLYDIANVFLSVGLLRKSENRSAATADGKRPQYYLNYHLSIHEIRSLYETLPQQMIDSKSPFSEEQLMKLKKTSSVRSKVKYFGLSEPTESTGIKDDPTKTTAAELLLESSPPISKNVSTHSLTLPGQTATDSTTLSTQPSTTTDSDSACYVKEAVTLSCQSSSTIGHTFVVENKKMTAIAVESSLDHTSSSTSPSCSSTCTDVPDNSIMKLNDESSNSDLNQDDVDIDDSVNVKNNVHDYVRTAATVSPNNSSTSIDILLNTTTATTSSSSPSSSSTTSILSPRRVSLEK